MVETSVPHTARYNPDGRVTARGQHLTGKSFLRLTLRPEVYPLVGCMIGAAGLIAFFGINHLTRNPDVRINKLERQKTIRQNQEEGRKWVQHHKTMRNLAPVVPGFQETREG